MIFLAILNVNDEFTESITAHKERHRFPCTINSERQAKLLRHRKFNQGSQPRLPSILAANNPYDLH
jgi:hypothetical protein